MVYHTQLDIPLLIVCIVATCGALQLPPGPAASAPDICSAPTPAACIPVPVCIPCCQTQCKPAPAPAPAPEPEPEPDPEPEPEPTPVPTQAPAPTAVPTASEAPTTALPPAQTVTTPGLLTTIEPMSSDESASEITAPPTTPTDWTCSKQKQMFANEGFQFEPVLDELCKFELRQCNEDKCWCVSMRRGRKRSDPFPSTEKFTCEYIPRGCIKDYLRSRMLTPDDGYQPACDPQSYHLREYLPKQCDTKKNVCWCVRRRGAKRRRIPENSPDLIKCPDRRQAKEGDDTEDTKGSN